VDHKREVLLIDSKKDNFFLQLSQWLSEYVLDKSPQVVINVIASVVSIICGGPLDKSQVSNYPFKFRITELKLQASSNVIPIGLINKGTFYHRALLFKALCDRIGCSPCILIRGDYNRAWNIVDLKKLTLTLSQNSIPKPIPDSLKLFMDQWELKISNLNLSEVNDLSQSEGGCFIVDLMFQPGRLISMDDPEAEAYQRIK
jgi:hypothetical protein